MMPLSQAIVLLQKFELFIEESQSEDLGRFALWLHKKYNGSIANMGAAEPYSSAMDREIGYLLGRINRYSRHYAKVAFERLPIGSIEEFWFLNVAFHKKNPSKTEIYEATITELATGTQMMRRLIELGLLTEEQDNEDKRIRRVQLTSEGKRVRNAALEALGVEVQLKMGNLEENDKSHFLRILRYLDSFHAAIYQEAGTKPLSALVDEYCLEHLAKE